MKKVLLGLLALSAVSFADSASVPVNTRAEVVALSSIQIVTTTGQIMDSIELDHGRLLNDGVAGSEVYVDFVVKGENAFSDGNLEISLSEETSNMISLVDGEELEDTLSLQPLSDIGLVDDSTSTSYTVELSADDQILEHRGRVTSVILADTLEDIAVGAYSNVGNNQPVLTVTYTAN